jgi:hypothetical protein
MSTKSISGGVRGVTQMGKRDADRIIHAAKKQQRRDIADEKSGKRGHGKHAIQKMSW